MTAYEHSTRRTARTLRAAQPAELLAEAHLNLRTVVRDCLVLIGSPGTQERPLIARIGLDRLEEDDASAGFAELMGTMGRQGCRWAFGFVVLRDGYERGPGDEDVAAAIRWCALVLIAAAEARPGPVEIPELWVLADEQALRVRILPVEDPDPREAPAYDLVVHPPEPLPSVDSTLVAAQAVAEGIALPVENPEADAALDEARPQVRALQGRLPAPPLDLAWERALAALGRLGRGVNDPGSEGYVTDCEHVAAFVDICDATDAVERLLALAVPSLAAEENCEGGCVEVMMTDPRIRPHHRICAGGNWYDGFLALRGMVRPPLRDRGDRRRAMPWISLSLTLAILAWWNHRYGTAGDLADEVLDQFPGEPLALCLMEMTRVPIPPAWQPFA